MGKKAELKTAVKRPVKSKNEELVDLLGKYRIDVDLKAEELSRQLGLKVTPILFINPDNFKDVIVGFLKDPARTDKMRMIDLCEQSRTQAGDFILRTSLIAEHSDARILEEKPENDPIYLGALDVAINIVVYYGNLIKKK